MQPLELSSLRAGSAFRVGFYCGLCGLGGFAIICGLFAIFGADVVKWNGEYVHGVGGLIAGLAIAFLFAIFSGIFAFLGMNVVRFISRWKKFGVIYFDNVDCKSEDKS